MNNERAKSSNPKDRIGVQKLPLSNIPLIALSHESLALTDGELKYGFVNWAAESVGTRTYIDAAFRHLHAYNNGEKYDPESGVHHLGHARACLAILLDAEQRGNLIDDRPPASGSPQKVREMQEEVTRLRKLRGKEINTKKTIIDIGSPIMPPFIPMDGTCGDYAEDPGLPQATTSKPVGNYESWSNDSNSTQPKTHEQKTKDGELETW